ncbi:unnamed protein product [Urochloa humidicola]
MRRPPPRVPSRQPPSLRRPAAPSRCSAPFRRAAHPSGPRARSAAAGDRRSGHVGAAASLGVQIGMPRIGDLTGELRPQFRGDLGGPATPHGAVRTPCPWSGPSGAARRLPSPRYPTLPAAAAASFVPPVSRPTCFVPPPPWASNRAAVHHQPHPWAYIRPAVQPHPRPCRPPPAFHFCRPPLPIRHPAELAPALPGHTVWRSHQPPPHLRSRPNMSGGGDDPFGNYSLPDPRFASGFYQPQPPPFSPPRFNGTGSQALPDAPPGFEFNNSFGTSSAAAAHGGFVGPAHAYAGSSAAAPAYAGSSAAVPFGGMAAPAQGCSGYGVPSPYHTGGLPMHDPARHSISLSGFQRGPCTFNGPFGEGSSHAGHAHFSHGPPSWNPANMGENEMSSAAPRRRMTRQHSYAHSPFASPFDDVHNTDHSMPSIGGDDHLSLASSSGDNAGLVGNAADLEEDAGNGDNMGSQGEDNSMEGDLVSSSGDDSSDEEYEQLSGDDLSDEEYEQLSGDDSSDGEYEQLYKGWEDLFGSDNPVFQGMKLLMDNSRRTTKLLKKAILECMYEESGSCTKHVREIN